MLRLFLLLSLPMCLLACATTATRSSAALQPLPHVDTERFLGTWYIIANIPYFPERGKVASRVEYVRRSDGRVDDLYYFRRSLDAPEQRWSGVAWTLDDSGARWKARFIWPFSTEFWVVDLDADYTVALVATPDAKLAWVYARSPTITPQRYQQALDRLVEFGVDTSLIEVIPR